MNKFIKFTESFKNNENASLIEAIQKGYKVLHEGESPDELLHRFDAVTRPKNLANYLREFASTFLHSIPHDDLMHASSSTHLYDYEYMMTAIIDIFKKKMANYHKFADLYTESENAKTMKYFARIVEIAEKLKPIGKAMDTGAIDDSFQASVDEYGHGPEYDIEQYRGY